MKPVDIMGTEIKLGDVVVKGSRSGNSGSLEVRVVSHIEGDSVWVRCPHASVSSKGSKVWFNDRLAVIKQ